MTVRWFVCRDFNGLAILVFRSEWLGHMLTHEEVWNKATRAWQNSKDISNWWMKGETNVDEISFLEALRLLAEQGYP